MVAGSPWWTASRRRDLTNPKDLSCAFYGHLFRKKGALSTGESTSVNDLKDKHEEIELLNLLWQIAAQTEPDRVPAPQFYESAATMAATPQFVQRALNALAKSSFCADIAQNMMFGNLNQVVRYFNDPDLREQAVQSVLALITPQTRVVVGHSLGSVVGYEALYRRSENVKSFVTIGSPLGMPNVVFNKLKPGPGALGVGRWPGKVRYWTNIADRGDLVANPKQLQPFFGSDLQDIPVYNGSDAHHAERYLTAVETGRAILQGINAA
jgi:hypothetical protein